MEAITIILYSLVFLAIWGAFSYDLKEQNAWHVSQGFKPKSQLRPFVFALCAIAVPVGLSLIYS